MQMPRSATRLLYLVSLLVLPAAAAGQDAATAGVDGQVPPLWTTGRRPVELFPAGDVFPVYVADPHRPTNQIAVAGYSRTRIPESDSPRTLMSGGGRFGLVRVGGATPDRWAWQLSLDAGIDAVFDSTYKNDGIGWDGNYGFTFTAASAAAPFSVKLAWLHVSAHLGDEYEARTDAERINYTREELAFAIAWRPRVTMRVYGELGLAYLNRNADQQGGRYQVGVEYERRPTLLGGRAALYGALEFAALEERDWRVDTTLQGGLVTRNHGRTYRLYLQWYRRQAAPRSVHVVFGSQFVARLQRSTYSWRPSGTLSRRRAHVETAHPRWARRERQTRRPTGRGGAGTVARRRGPSWPAEPARRSPAHE